MANELDSIITKINNRYAKGTTDTKPIIVRGEAIKETLKPVYVPTGIQELDDALGGGIPKGASICVYGDPGCGKTSLALMVIVQIQKAGGVAVWVNAEPPFPYEAAMMLGVDLDALYIINAKDYGEQILDVLRELLFDSKNRITRSVVDIVAVDSINGLIPKAQIDSVEDKGSEGHTMGRRAAMLSKWLEEVAGRAMLREGAILFNIAQKRVDINAYGAPEKASGGKGLQFLAKVTVWMKKKRIDGVSWALGHEVAFGVEKNNVSCKLGEGSYQVMYGIGVNDSLKIITEAFEKNLIQKVKGKVYQVVLPDEVVTFDEGIDSVRNHIKSNVEFKNRIKKALEDGFNPNETNNENTGE